MAFCGKYDNGTGLYGARGFNNDCFLSGLNLVPPLLFMLLALPIIFVLNCGGKRDYSLEGWVHFPGHVFRWILFLCVYVTNLAEIADGLLSDMMYEDSHLHIHVMPAVYLIANIVAAVYYHNTEMNNSPQLLLLLVVYWLGALLTKAVKFRYLVDVVGLTVVHMRFDLTFDNIAIYGGMLVIELIIFIKLRYICFKRKVKLKPAVELFHSKYIYSFVNLLSKASFVWVDIILKVGYKRPLEISDLGALPKSEQSAYVHDKFSKNYLKEKERAQATNTMPSLWQCYWVTHKKTLLLSGVYKLLGDLFTFAGPLCLIGMIRYVDKTEAEKEAKRALVAANVTDTSTTMLPHGTQYINYIDFYTNGFVLAAVLFISMLLLNTFFQASFQLCIREGIRLRASLQGMVYQKTLKLSSWCMTSGRMTQGQIVNHIAVDTFHMMIFFYLIHHTWSIPVKLALTVVLIYFQLGYSGLIGCAIMILFAPLQFFIAKATAKLQKKVLETSDIRLKQVNELFLGIKLIKLYAWEMIFCDTINKARIIQLQGLMKSAMLNAFISFLSSTTPVFVTLVAFGLYTTIEKEPLTAAKAFGALALFNILQQPLAIFPMLVKTVVNAKISTHRLKSLLAISEIGHVGNPKIVYGEVMNGVSHSHTENQKPSTSNDVTDSSVEDPLLPDRSLGADLRSPDTYEAAANPAMMSNTRHPETGDIRNLHHHDEGPSRSPSPSKTTSPGEPVVEIVDGSFTWDEEGQEPYFEHLNFKVLGGQLNIVVGAVGCGKSSLISALLGEMTQLHGTVHFARRVHVAYVPQKPWLLNTTLQHNILFGHKMDKKRYRRVLDACSLHHDISMLPAGDRTEIGEKGINLSGGQKARISMARAMYSGADLIILDDPLSALDMHVGTHLFEHGIMNFLIRHRRTVLLVTHHLQYLRHAATISRLEGGKITHTGSLADIKDNDPELYNAWQDMLKRVKNASSTELAVEKPQYTRKISASQRMGSITSLESIDNTEKAAMITLSRHLSEIAVETPDLIGVTVDHSHHIAKSWSSLPDVEEGFEGIPLKDEEVSDRAADGQVSAEVVPVGILSSPTSILPMDAPSSPNVSSHKVDSKDEQEDGRLIEDEDRETGAVAAHVYSTYMRACSIILVGLVLFLMVARTACAVCTNFWLAEWTSSGSQSSSPVITSNGTEQTDTNSTAGQPSQPTSYYLNTYILLSVTTIVLSLLGSFMLYAAGVKASYSLHSIMLNRVVHAPMRFFDTTPLGRILNRFSGDISTVDDKLPATLMSVLQTLFSVFSSVVVSAVATPFFIIPVIPILIVYYFLQKYFRASARELQRLDSITKSPVLAHFSETLGGLTSIRAYKDEQRFQQAMYRFVDTNTAAFLWLNTANRWLGVRLDHLGSCIVFSATICALVAGVHGTISSGIVGLSIAYALNVSNLLNWVIRTITDAEMQMNAVERIKYYSSIPVEPEPHGKSELPKEWPSRGEIVFNDVSLRYSQSLSPAVRHITFKIGQGEKVGICGRTGSGKSTLILGLFRVIDIADGSILIDGIDTSQVKLHQLRSNIAVIPQDPVMFEGSIRFNLDPTGKRDDAALWQALEIAQMKETVKQQADEFNSLVSEGGENFSVGQRQLFCLARAFLKHSTILVMDEATSSIDLETDRLIQKVIRTAFKDCTVLTIAHRVATIIDYDRVIVLKDGHLVENDSPKALLKQPESLFANLVKSRK